MDDALQLADQFVEADKIRLQFDPLTDYLETSGTQDEVSKSSAQASTFVRGTSTSFGSSASPPPNKLPLTPTSTNTFEVHSEQSTQKNCSGRASTNSEGSESLRPRFKFGFFIYSIVTKDLEVSSIIEPADDWLINYEEFKEEIKTLSFLRKKLFVSLNQPCFASKSFNPCSSQNSNNSNLICDSLSLEADTQQKSHLTSNNAQVLFQNILTSTPTLTPTPTPFGNNMSNFNTDSKCRFRLLWIIGINKL